MKNIGKSVSSHRIKVSGPNHLYLSESHYQDSRVLISENFLRFWTQIVFQTQLVCMPMSVWDVLMLCSLCGPSASYPTQHFCMYMQKQEAGCKGQGNLTLPRIHSCFSEAMPASIGAHLVLSNSQFLPGGHYPDKKWKMGPFHHFCSTMCLWLLWFLFISHCPWVHNKMV